MDRDFKLFSAVKLEEDETNNKDTAPSGDCITGSQVDALCSSAVIHSFTKTESFDDDCQERKQAIAVVTSLNEKLFTNLKNPDVCATPVQTKQETSDADTDDFPPSLRDVFRSVDKPRVTKHKVECGISAVESVSDDTEMSASFQVGDIATEVDRRSVELGKRVEMVKTRKLNDYTETLDLQSELNANEKERAHSCPYCEKLFAYKSNLNEHMRRHTGEKAFTCTRCDKHFASNGELVRHLVVHSEERPYECLYCEKRFGRKYDLEVHVQRRHVRQKAFACTKCDKQFVKHDELFKHLAVHSGERPYECPHCEKRFGRKYDLDVHVQRRHLRQKAFACTKCDKQFVISCDLRRHSGEKRHECHYCNMRFGQRRYLSAHIRKHRNETQHTCSQCNEKFVKESELRNQSTRHSEETLDECENRDNRSYRFDKLENHVTTHTHETQLTNYMSDAIPSDEHQLQRCRKATQMDNSRKQCGKKPPMEDSSGDTPVSPFTRLLCAGVKHDVVDDSFGETLSDDEKLCSVFCDHMLYKYSEADAPHKLTKPASVLPDAKRSSEYDVGPFNGLPKMSPSFHASDTAREVDHGSAEFGKRVEKAAVKDNDYANKPDRLLSGLNAHEKEKAYSCQFCEQMFSCARYQKAHEKIHTAVKVYSCPYCEKLFTHSGNLNAHMIRHTGEKAFTCAQCGKQFVSKTELTRHVAVHTAARPYECPHCEKRFSRNFQLQVHMSRHVGEMAFKCAQCEKQFVSNHELTRHSVVHSGDRPYECPFCAKRFGWQDSLKYHVLRHIGERAFNCTQCDKKFVSRHDLRRHILTHSEEKRHECQYCNKRFKQPRYLLVHIHRHKNETQHTCSQCSEQFVTESELINHSTSLNEETVDECEYRDNSSDGRDKLQNQLTTHAHETTNNVSDAVPSDERRQLQRWRKATQTDYSSQQCGKKLKMEYSAGETVPDDEKLFLESCDPLLYNYSDADAPHKTEPASVHPDTQPSSTYDDGPSIGLVVSITKPFVCENCPNGYSVSSQLQQHSLTHDDVKTSYECEECRTRFTDYGQLLWHMLAHAQEGHAHQQQVLQQEAMDCSQTVIKREPLNG